MNPFRAVTNTLGNSLSVLDTGTTSLTTELEELTTSRAKTHSMNRKIQDMDNEYTLAKAKAEHAKRMSKIDALKL